VVRGPQFEKRWFRVMVSLVYKPKHVAIYCETKEVYQQTRDVSNKQKKKLFRSQTGHHITNKYHITGISHIKQHNQGFLLICPQQVASKL